MKQVIIIYSILLFFVLSSCTSQAQNNDSSTNNAENYNLLKLVKTYYFDKDSVASLEILKNDTDNYILLQTRWRDQIVSICGNGNTDFAVNDDNSLKFDTLYFEKGEKIYLLRTYVFGSTYGAVVYYLIYGGNYPNACEIYKIPFDRVDIETDKNGLSKIVSYTSYNRTLKYIFKDGILQQVK
jgi:competence protein ComGC